METNIQLARHGLFDARVPRYTSYPTSPHFAGNVGPDLFADWIGAIPEGGQISLYIHVPFCRRLCWFCACRTQGTSSDAPVRAYLETLKAEIEILRSRLPEGVTLERLHWGGGTPTLLAPDMMTELAEAIYSVAPLAEDGEFSVEIDPNEIDGARLDALAAAGLNRASIGVQDFDPEIQKVIGREQSYELTAEAVHAIRARGVKSLNTDILYGLPYQTPEKITESVQKLLSLAPDRVALYGYAHVPWMARRQTMIPEEALPSAEQRLGLFETAQKLFKWDGYDEIGIDHFALPSDSLSIAQKAGRLRRNFQGYTEDTSEVLVGLGASSISKFPQGYAQNASATSQHTAAIRAGGFSTKRGHRFTAEDKLRARLIEALMCDFVVDAAEIASERGLAKAEVEKLVAPVAAQFSDVVSYKNGRLEVPPSTRPLTRVIARGFDAYELSKTGHSSAV
ncbi:MULTISPECIES: oxygen-independent coproporphyrinogen III oxidase [Halocynthiibacter]|uniref:Coproporphyrinogen-III oxidase n=1 Tax=Halocynthiibacter halioticoli TaxID=2986804 RepID=A0AAE3IWF1_9RHOB|nr:MULTISPECIES: oxygen-independent coproporphyrinogen III oxidase [Halocynthiibacter]MCV6823338.1 oxygen-independent coproporphyrinogen III oxidase [Halocynthiibacter halioticoli]MCW4056339.1 oxygen-independent coproporphyrinogen III oxidase [Halocynthiibacter sp. SDUM655004]